MRSVSRRSRTPMWTGGGPISFKFFNLPFFFSCLFSHRVCNVLGRIAVSTGCNPDHPTVRHSRLVPQANGRLSHLAACWLVSVFAGTRVYSYTHSLDIGRSKRVGSQSETSVSIFGDFSERKTATSASAAFRSKKIKKTGVSCQPRDNFVGK
jgi:hypothetical protein